MAATLPRTSPRQIETFRNLLWERGLDRIQHPEFSYQTSAAIDELLRMPPADPTDGQMLAFAEKLVDYVELGFDALPVPTNRREASMGLARMNKALEANAAKSFDASAFLSSAIASETAAA